MLFVCDLDAFSHVWLSRSCCFFIWFFCVTLFSTYESCSSTCHMTRRIKEDCKHLEVQLNNMEILSRSHLVGKIWSEYSWYLGSDYPYQVFIRCATLVAVTIKPAER